MKASATFMTDLDTDILNRDITGEGLHYVIYMTLITIDVRKI